MSLYYDVYIIMYNVQCVHFKENCVPLFHYVVIFDDQCFLCQHFRTILLLLSCPITVDNVIIFVFYIYIPMIFCIATLQEDGTAGIREAGTI